MRICQPKEFCGKRIKGVLLGWSPAGPPLMTVHCFVFGRTMVDTGLAHMGKEALAMARAHNVEQVFLTHHHEDHSGNAALIREQTGAVVFGHELAGKKLERPFPILPYQKLIWGKSRPVEVAALTGEVRTELGPLVPVHTPGHSKDHLCYWLPDQGVLFSGDLYLGDRIKFFRSDEDLVQETVSLKKAAALDFDTLLCNHNPRPEKGKAHILSKLSFLEAFCGQVADLYAKGCGEREIFRRLSLRENRPAQWLCFGNVSMMNGVRSVIRSMNGQDGTPSSQGRIRG